MFHKAAHRGSLARHFVGPDALVPVHSVFPKPATTKLICSSRLSQVLACSQDLATVLWTPLAPLHFARFSQTQSTKHCHLSHRDLSKTEGILGLSGMALAAKALEFLQTDSPCNLCRAEHRVDFESPMGSLAVSKSVTSMPSSFSFSWSTNSTVCNQCATCVQRDLTSSARTWSSSRTQVETIQQTPT